MRYVAPLIALALAACTRVQQEPPQAVTPVRLDTARITMVPLEASAPETTVVLAESTTVADPFAPLEPIDWPGPNQYRSSNGAPGPAYWQQRADYTISVSLDTAAQTVSGDVAIRYTNNSPDTLRFVWLQLDQNLYRPGSEGSALFAAESRWGVRGLEGGYTLDSITVNGRPVTPHVNGTLMRLDLERPLAPRGGKGTIAMQFRFRVPEHGSDRMGRDGTLYEIAQWYPRMVVYDDVRGWNADPYLGQGEFYLEYGDIDYAITAPAGYTIAGSGVLRNPAEVLTVEQRARLAQAMRSQTVVPVITAKEAQTTPTPGTKTWRFHAENVRDVAWAGAPDFRWDATNYNGRVLTQAFYQFAKTGRAWEEAAEQTCWSIKMYSEKFFPYPYPQATSVAGPVGGMEYPMFVMVHYGENGDPNSVFGTIDHEHGHEWFPMIVGSNERRYAWMDEGLDTYINAFSNEARYPGRPVWPGYIANWKAVVANETQSPLMTAPDRIVPTALGAIGYRKPAAVLLTLRNHVLDPDTFDRALRLYIRRWAFKHPTPADFFRTIENYAGQDLSWFWRGFFYTTDVLDIGLERVATAGEASGLAQATVTLRRVTSIPFPVALRFKMADGSTQDVRLPVQIWSTCASSAARAPAPLGRGSGCPYAGGCGCDRVEATVPLRGEVVGARLWPDPTVPDWNAANDTWGAAPPADPPSPVTDDTVITSAAQP